MERARLSIEGMTCDHCLRAVSRALQGVRGVEVERVELGSAEIRFDGSAASVAAATAALEEEGYAVAGVGRLA